MPKGGIRVGGSQWELYRLQNSWTCSLCQGQSKAWDRVVAWHLSLKCVTPGAEVLGR